MARGRLRRTSSIAIATIALSAGVSTVPAWAGGLSGATNLVGTFSITSGKCADSGPPTGSYLQIEVEGTAIPNLSSPCAAEGGAFTPLTQGTAGLVTGAYQSDPVPTFSPDGDALASGIIHPVRFLANTIGLATTCADQSSAPTPTGACGQGANGFPVPSLSEVPAGEGTCPASSTGDCLSGDLSSLGATWAGFPLKKLATDSFDPVAILSSLGSTCVTASGCDAVGVSQHANSPSPTCVDATAAASCALFGTIDPKDGAYTLALSSGIALSVLPHAMLRLVLRGTFTPAAPGATSALGLVPGIAPAPPAGQVTPAGPSGTSTTTSSSTGPSGYSPSQAEEMNGVFALSPASCTGTTPVGSFLTIDFNTVSEGNPSSPCDGGAYTLLQPGTSGLALGSFTPNPSPTFDANGNSLANSIVAPATFKGHALGLATSPDDVQDAPAGPATFAPPVAVVQGSNLAVDLRSLNVTYQGTPGTTCAQAYGVGCWLEGSRIATGTFDPTTGDFVLDWYSSQDFTGGSGEVDFHLVGHFNGSISTAASAVVNQLSSSNYVVTSSSEESDSYAPSTAASAPAATTSTTAPSPATTPRSAAPADGHKVQVIESDAEPVDHHSTGGAPLRFIGIGVLALLALLLVGRRSRRSGAHVEEEQT
jgi:hypothetical protein